MPRPAVSSTTPSAVRHAAKAHRRARRRPGGPDLPPRSVGAANDVVVFERASGPGGALRIRRAGATISRGRSGETLCSRAILPASRRRARSPACAFATAWTSPKRPRSSPASISWWWPPAPLIGRPRCDRQRAVVDRNGALAGPALAVSAAAVARSSLLSGLAARRARPIARFARLRRLGHHHRRCRRRRQNRRGSDRERLRRRFGVIRSAPTSRTSPEPAATARRSRAGPAVGSEHADGCRPPPAARAGAALKPMAGLDAVGRLAIVRPSQAFCPEGSFCSGRPMTWRRGSAFDWRLVLPTS